METSLLIKVASRFRYLKVPPSSTNPDGMSLVFQYRHSEGPIPNRLRASIRPGDVIAFHMSHREAWTWLQKGSIQKLPYELFRYGHIALIVPDPEKSLDSSDSRLLQIAMNQAANTTDSLEYLNNKSWHVFRPPHGRVSPAKLVSFTRQVVQTAGNPGTAYD